MSNIKKALDKRYKNRNLNTVNRSIYNIELFDDDILITLHTKNNRYMKIHINYDITDFKFNYITQRQVRNLFAKHRYLINRLDVIKIINLLNEKLKNAIII